MSNRLNKVNTLIRRELGTILNKEFEFKNALVTITSVDTTQDIKEAKIYFSVMGAGVQTITKTLQAKRGFIQSKLSKRVVLKNTPILDFRRDDSTEKGIGIVELLQEVDQIAPASGCHSE